jgi:hypothetical protein
MPDGLSDIIIADRLSDANQVRIPSTSDLQVSWEINRAGQLSCQVTYQDLVAAGVQPGNLKSKWVHYTHPTAGPWGGQITSVAGGDTPGTIVINAESWASCYRGHFGHGDNEGTVQYLVMELLDAVASQTGIKRGALDIPGVGAKLFDDTWDIYESILPAVVEYIDNREPYSLIPAGYNVDPVTRVISIKRVIGRDLSATVKLADRVHNVESSWSDDSNDFINYLVLEGKYNISTPYDAVTGYKDECTKWKKKKNGKKVCKQWKTVEVWGTKYRTDEMTGTVVALNQASINKHGRKSDYISITSFKTFASLTDLRTHANALLAARSIDQQLVSITCADIDGIWSRFREGDVIAVDLSLSGLIGKMAVRSRALDVTRGIMIVAGEAELKAA